MGAVGRTEGAPVSFYVAGDPDRGEARGKSCRCRRKTRSWQRHLHLVSFLCVCMKRKDFNLL
jgi:hypothetical protein